MEQETIYKARVTRLRNKLRREIADSNWSMRGTEFSTFKWLGLYAEYKFAALFFCNLKRVRVHIYGMDGFNIPDADKTFKGDEAWSDCIDWTVEQIVEMTENVNKSIEAYTERNRDAYIRKVFKGA